AEPSLTRSAARGGASARGMHRTRPQSLEPTGRPRLRRDQGSAPALGAAPPETRAFWGAPAGGAWTGPAPRRGPSTPPVADWAAPAAATAPGPIASVAPARPDSAGAATGVRSRPG